MVSSLSILGKLAWIDGLKLRDFIVACEDPEAGGIADRPGNVGDVYHTFFGLCGLSLLEDAAEAGQVQGKATPTAVSKSPALIGSRVDPVFALPRRLVKELGLASQTLR